MNVAFYAPLKAVDHPVPSGDREMARAFMTLLDGLGHDVRVASTLRSFDKAGSQSIPTTHRSKRGSGNRPLGRCWP